MISIWWEDLQKIWVHLDIIKTKLLWIKGLLRKILQTLNHLSFRTFFSYKGLLRCLYPMIEINSCLLNSDSNWGSAGSIIYKPKNSCLLMIKKDVSQHPISIKKIPILLTITCMPFRIVVNVDILMVSRIWWL